LQVAQKQRRSLIAAATAPAFSQILFDVTASGTGLRGKSLEDNSPVDNCWKMQESGRQKSTPFRECCFSKHEIKDHIRHEADQKAKYENHHQVKY
jgi:hypothetical protein